MIVSSTREYIRTPVSHTRPATGAPVSRTAPAAARDAGIALAHSPIRSKRCARIAQIRLAGAWIVISTDSLILRPSVTGLRRAGNSRAGNGIAAPGVRACHDATNWRRAHEPVRRPPALLARPARREPDGARAAGRNDGAARLVPRNGTLAAQP